MSAGSQAPVVAIADEDLERSNETKTSAVHFLRFELSSAMIDALRAGAPLAFAVAHPHYAAQVTLDPAVREALLADLD